MDIRFQSLKLVVLSSEESEYPRQHQTASSTMCARPRYLGRFTDSSETGRISYREFTNVAAALAVYVVVDCLLFEMGDLSNLEEPFELLGIKGSEY